MTRLTRWISSILVLLLAGCAGLDVRPVGGDESWTRQDHGFRYYMPVPYLLVSKASVSPVRIDFTKDKTVLAPSGGQEVPVELGKLVGLDPKQPITVTISDNTAIGFKTPDASSPDEKRTTVKALDNGIVQVDVVFRNHPPENKPATLTLTAQVGSMTLGSGTYEVKASGPHNVIKSLGGPVRAGYTITTVYLPDRTRALAIDPVEGIGGSAEINFKLKDGWMLTEVGSKIDTQADETINAVANVVEAIGSAAGSVAALSTRKEGVVAGERPSQEEDLSGLYRPVFEDGLIVAYEKVELRLR